MDYIFRQEIQIETKSSSKKTKTNQESTRISLN